MKPTCPKCRSESVTVSKNQRVLRCRACLHSWTVGR